MEINILEFVKEYKENPVGALEKLEVENYVPFATKRALIDTVIESIIEYDTSLLTYEPMNKHLNFSLTCVVTLTVPVKISSLDDGIYKVKGQCIIGGNNTTVQSSADALFTDHTYGNMKGATSSSAGSAGLVPAPNIGEQLKFLRADGTWVIPTNTTYSVGTSSYLGITKLYTETGSATDGTMTQNAITSALNGKSPTSHTHNYAGSSSAGGAATSAIKLSTPRKIGNASFDGTADITLSQMGLNVPVEITKANYLAKKKAGTLNANTYYNVIDEYDSANVINDSSVTTNSTFSSTKSEKTYAKKSTLVNTTLTASKWTGSSAPYTYVLPVSGATTSNIVEINYASNASSQAIEAYQNAMLADGGQTTNQITIKATEKPTVDIPITIVIRNDL